MPGNPDPSGGPHLPPPATTFALRSTRVVTPEATRPATVTVTAGRIDEVLPYETRLPADVQLTELGDDALLPGLVDTHVHVNDPGRSAWEGFDTATRAAAAGGITTLLDMPLNSLPPTTSVEHLRTKQDVARPKAYVDTGFWGGAIPGNLAELRPLYEAGVFGFKCFLSPSGVEEFPELAPDALELAAYEIVRFDGLLIVHAEAPHRLEAAAGDPHSERYTDFLASRPRDAEGDAIRQLIALARASGARVHVLHLSAADVLPQIRAAQQEGVRLSVETCPHFLTLTAEEIPDGATEFKCCPPIREGANQDALWQGLADGTIESVVSDHSPCTTDLKTADFMTAWGGISSLQLGLPAVWTEARRRGHELADVARWMSTGPAQMAGLTTKGAITPGRDADFAVLAPEERFTVDPTALHHRNQVTAYAGRTLHGVVRSSWLRGERISEHGQPVQRAGRLIERKHA